MRVRLSVEHGWLTISGKAAHKVERSAAECVVRYVPGVKGVTNDIVVVMADRR
jgi:osmotically-inducible protein OsmY